MAKKPHRVGPYSRAIPLVSLDGRTREARFIRQMQAELCEHLGGAPSATQFRIIKNVCFNTMLYEKLVGHILSNGGAATDHDGRQLLAWSNSIRRDCAVLGLDRRPDTAPRLGDVLRGAA